MKVEKLMQFLVEKTKEGRLYDPLADLFISISALVVIISSNAIGGQETQAVLDVLSSCKKEKGRYVYYDLIEFLEWFWDQDIEDYDDPSWAGILKVVDKWNEFYAWRRDKRKAKGE